MPGKTCDKCSQPFKGFGKTCGLCRKGGKAGGQARDCEKCGSFFVGFGDVCSECQSGKGPGRTGVRAPTPEEVDVCLDRIDASIQKVDASQQSMVRLRKAEIDLLWQLEIVRDIIQRILRSGNRALLKSTFVDCGRVARLSAFLGQIHLSETNQGDQRLKNCKDVLRSLTDMVEKDMGLGEQLKEAAETADTGLLMKRLSFLMDEEKVAAHQAEVDSMLVGPPARARAEAPENLFSSGDDGAGGGDAAASSTTLAPPSGDADPVGASTVGEAPPPACPALDQNPRRFFISTGCYGGGYYGGGYYSQGIGGGTSGGYRYGNHAGYPDLPGAPMTVDRVQSQDVDDYSDWEDEDLEEMPQEQADALFENNARILFDQLDVNTDGALSKEEVLNGASGLFGLLKACRIHKRKHVVKMFKDGDIDNNGALDFTEFMTYIRAARQKALAAQPKQIDDAKVEKVFALMDKDGDGTITEDELSRAYAGLLLMAGEVVNSKRVADWASRNFKKYDTDGSAGLDLGEFKLLLQNSGALAPMLDYADGM